MREAHDGSETNRQSSTNYPPHSDSSTWTFIIGMLSFYIVYLIDFVTCYLRLVISGTKRVDHLDGGWKQLDESKCQCQGPSRTNRVAWNGANLRQWNQYCFEGKTWKLKKATIVFDWMWIKNCLVIWKLDNKNRDIEIRWSIQILTSQFRFSWPKKRTSFLATCPRFVLFTVRYSCQILRAAYPAHS